MRGHIGLFLLIVWGLSAHWTMAQIGDSDAKYKSRAEWWLEKKRAKFEAMEPVEIPALDRFFLWLEEKGLMQKSTVSGDNAGFSPEFGSVTSGSGLAGGVAYKNPQLSGWPIGFETAAQFSIRGYQLYELRLGKIRKRANRLRFESPDQKITSQFDGKKVKEQGLSLFADLRYRHFPQQDFFGIGPTSRLESRSDYLLRGASWEGVAEYQFNRWLGTSFRAGLLQFEIGPGSDDRFADTVTAFSPGSAPGLGRQPDILHFSSALLADYRDQPGSPHSGGIAGLIVSRFDDRGSHGLRFDRIAFDARQYLPLGNERRILALRFFTSSDNPAAGSRVPFYLQHWLGGSDTLRGFDSFRFQDNNLLYMSAEYRWETIPTLELALFYDAGKVFPQFSDFSFKNLENSYGFGARVKTPDSVLFRIDWSRSREGSRINWTTGAAF
ncbi:MAG: BamA/TamA family outer membrane protein [Acidobacteriota bacterium]